MLSQIDATPKLYIGLDIHKKSWSVSIKTDLFDHKTCSMPPGADGLYDYVSTNFPLHSVEVCYEAGCCGFSAARAFLNFGWSVTIVNPADVPRMNKQNYQKTDKIDSRNLAKQLQNKSLTPIHIPTEEQEQFRSLLRQRNIITKQLRKTKTHIKSMLLFHGIEIPSQYDNANWTKEFKKWIQELQWTNSCGKLSMDSKMKTLDFIYNQYLSIGNELRAYCRKNHKEDYYLLMSIPGIGGFLAAAILAECGDLRRFNNESQLSSYIGVVPGIHNSGSSEMSLGVTPRANKILRPFIIESAWIAIRKDPEIQAYYRKHFGKNPKSIIVKVAHKMVRRILSVIKNNKPYEINKNLTLDQSIQLPKEVEEALIEENDE
jgi:transposase